MRFSNAPKKSHVQHVSGTVVSTAWSQNVVKTIEKKSYSVVQKVFGRTSFGRYTCLALFMDFATLRAQTHQTKLQGKRQIARYHHNAVGVFQ